MGALIDVGNLSNPHKADNKVPSRVGSVISLPLMDSVFKPFAQ